MPHKLPKSWGPAAAGRGMAIRSSGGGQRGQGAGLDPDLCSGDLQHPCQPISRSYQVFQESLPTQTTWDLHTSQLREYLIVPPPGCTPWKEPAQGPNLRNRVLDCICPFRTRAQGQLPDNLLPGRACRQGAVSGRGQLLRLRTTNAPASSAGASLIPGRET